MKRAQYAVLIPTQGPARPQTIDTASENILAELQSLVGGYIETYCIRKWILLCNEEGKLHRLPVNAAATYLFMQNPCDYFAGDVLLVVVEDDGENFAYFTYSDALDIAETINAACGL